MAYMYNEVCFMNVFYNAFPSNEFGIISRPWKNQGAALQTPFSFPK